METGQFIPNYSDCVLMNRKIVEDLNAEIKVCTCVCVCVCVHMLVRGCVYNTHINMKPSHRQELGKAKISIMRECKDFKKGIHLLEWLEADNKATCFMSN